MHLDGMYTNGSGAHRICPYCGRRRQLRFDGGTSHWPPHRHCACMEIPRLATGHALGPLRGR